MNTSVKAKLAKIISAFVILTQYIGTLAHNLLTADVYIGRDLNGVPPGAIVFFPYRQNILFCGIAALVSYKRKNKTNDLPNTASLDDMIMKIERLGCEACKDNDYTAIDDHYLGGNIIIDSLWQAVQSLKREDYFLAIFTNLNDQKHLADLCDRLTAMVEAEAKLLADHMGRIPAQKVELMAAQIEKLKDIAWCIRREILDNIKKIGDLCSGVDGPTTSGAIGFFKKLNAVLNSIDRLEVRGRDSAGISLVIVLNRVEFDKFIQSLKQAGIYDRLNQRRNRDTLVNRGISIDRLHKDTEKEQIAITITYKVADEIGSLGDNIIFLRRQISQDPILQIVAACSAEYDTFSAHTRWASVGAITEANCHPVDNRTVENSSDSSGIIHTCLNGDIDNYQQLKREFELGGGRIHQDITTDTKIIPLVIDKYFRQGHTIDEAFRLAVNDFEGSHAISMHTDLAPGKIFLAQKGSGQALFVGISPDHFMPTSEVYGFVEETQYYIKLDGETVAQGSAGPTQGQIFILNQQSAGGLEGISARYYDGTPIKLGEADIKHTEITSRDIDRQGYPHYFLKEISESPDSMEKTLQNRWKLEEDGKNRYTIALDDTVIPPSLKKALTTHRIKRIFFIGQGTAGVAALACANILSYYMDSTAYNIGALKASEFSGFHLNEHDNSDSMADALVIAISQSGTTTDTNRTVDMVKERGAHTLAIVNRRDSDITFKVDGVMYTSSGRDIEMSVASTKAFYSQIVAGAILGLYMAALQKRRNAAFVTREIEELLKLPSHMREILNMKDAIKDSATKLAVTKTYWAAVGSGPNKASADEIRIKLSELCYKTISSDFVEDKKHIDLSSEPLIIVCAAGTRNTVIGDIIKDTAIFKAHKATPVVIANQGEDRFAPYADTVFHVPPVNEHLAPILNTLVGHIWGYYAALSINEGSRLLYGFQEEIKNTVDEFTAQGLDVYEIILEKTFREKIAKFYNNFRQKRAAKQFPVTIGMDVESDLTLLLKYLSGRLPVSDFDLDFNQKGTAVNMLNSLFSCLANAIGTMARPVDAIKHQAKTVTVGTSRISERIEGILFDAINEENLNISQLTNTNIIVLKNLQGVIEQIEGSTLYRIGGLSVLGEPAEDTTIEVIKKRGDIAAVPSRVESDNRLKGTKRIIIRQGNVYIGKGRKDERSILVIPILTASDNHPNRIEYLLLLHVSFMENVALDKRIKALGGKFEHIKNIVQENSIAWHDRFLDLVEIEELFGRSAEKIGDFIVGVQNGRTSSIASTC
jgi:glucosamine--fructose-6-phosphate aminotransferase (isomerizing)